MAKISQKPQGQLHVDDGYLIALAKQGNADAYDRLYVAYLGLYPATAPLLRPLNAEAGDRVGSGA